MSRFYLTTAIDYVNSPPHLGTAYEKITADVIARYHRLCGDDTHFVMGNDEHSQNVYRRAVELGLDPAEYCDRMAMEFRDVWAGLDISFDDFIRTTEPRHRAGVTEMFRRIAAAGDLYEGHYEGWYCDSCESFKQEKDLIGGSCPTHLKPPDWIREKNHFFRLSKYRRPLLEHFAAHPEFLVPDIRRNEILRLLESGLEDISVSRAGQLWGIPLPIDPSSVVYVWFDALINYASAVGLGTDAARFADWWPADLHIIGKDITRFHAVFWPAMLMSAGVALPRQVFGHGFVSLGGQKMSKSLGTVLDPRVAVQRLGPDPLRLYLVKEIPHGSDGDFSWERYEERYNVDLANNLGNLVSRLATMTHRYRDGQLPGGPVSGRLADTATESVREYRRAMESFALHAGAAAAFRIVDAANEYLAETEPWSLARDPAQAERLTGVLGDVTEAIRLAAVLLSPMIPASAAEILRRVGAPIGPDGLRLDRDGTWRSGVARLVLNAEPLWPRLAAPPASGQAATDGSTAPPLKRRAITMTEEQKDIPKTPPPTDSAAGGDQRISIEDFMRVEMRVARVVAAERVPNSKKLIKLQVDVGSEQRTLVAGIADAYEADALVGRTVAVVVNLKPAKLMGIESNGMVLAASPEGGQPSLVTFDEPLPPVGSRVR